MAKHHRFSDRSIRAFSGVHPDLVIVMRHGLELSPIDFAVTEGVRNLKRQAELVASGASHTMKSRHLPGAVDNLGHAVDVAAWVNEIRWDLGLYYRIASAVQQASKLTGIPVRWGGCWLRLDTTEKTPSQLVKQYVESRTKAKRRAFIDGPHFELPDIERYR